MFLFNSSNSIGTTVPAPVYAAQPTPASRSKFDPLNYLRSKTTDGGESVTVGRKMQTVIPVRKPSKQQFVHAHPSPDYRPDGQPDAASIAPPSSPASTQGASLPQSKGVVHG
jgi:hypothetical protein